jgi:hypothetical protein
MDELTGDLRADMRAGPERVRLKAGKVDVAAVRLGPVRLSVASADAVRLPGLVDLYEGERQVSRCLIVAAEVRAGETIFELKRESPMRLSAPKDFAAEEPDCVP